MHTKRTRGAAVCRTLALALSTLALACAVFARPAYADVPATITTGDELHELLSQTSASATSGKTYTLANDVTVDTSDLDTSYDSGNASRVFAGVLNGGGHTVTVKAADGGAQPLFDRIASQTSTGARAEVKSLNIVFEGDARGATLAGSASNVGVSDVTVTFGVVNPVISRSSSVACGLVAWIDAGGDIPTGVYTLVEDTEVTGARIGSASAPSAGAGSVVSAGMCAYSNGVAASVLRDSVVSVDEILASGNSSGTVIAAGAVADYQQVGVRLDGMAVRAGTIDAGTTGRANVCAVGLAYHPLAVSQCAVNAGSVTARDDGDNASNRVIACGLAFQADTYRNDEVEASTASATVNVEKTVSVTDASGGTDVACGLAYSAGADVPWRDTHVNVGSVSATDEGSSDAANAMAAGLSITSYNRNRESFSIEDADTVSVTADSIAASSARGCAYAFGLEMYNYYPKSACEVSVGAISAVAADDAAAAGACYFMSVASDDFESGVVYDACDVTVDSIASRADNTAATAGFSIATKIGDGGDAFEIRGCSVKVGSRIDAVVAGESDPSCIGLFSGDDLSATKLTGNVVTLPEAQAHVVEKDGAAYVRFTTSQEDGQAARDDWASGNRVLFSDSHNGGDVSCAFDDGSEGGTLWLVSVRTGDLSVSVDASGAGAKETDEFEVTVTLDDDTVSGTYGDMTFDAGVATLRLRSSEVATASDIPAGIGYKVSVAPPDGYEVKDSEGTEGTIVAGETSAASFSLENDAIPTPDTPVTPGKDAGSSADAGVTPATGDSTPTGLVFLGIATAGVLGILVGVTKRHG